jgi:hypothetical protein
MQKNPVRKVRALSSSGLRSNVAMEPPSFSDRSRLNALTVDICDTIDDIHDDGSKSAFPDVVLRRRCVGNAVGWVRLPKGVLRLRSVHARILYK